MALQAVTKAGAHVLVADNVYGNTRAFCEGVLTQQGVIVEFFDPEPGAGVAALCRPETCAIMFAAPGTGTFVVTQARVMRLMYADSSK